MSQQIILLAHGSRDPKWALPMEAIRQMLESDLPTRQVKLAFLEFMSPNLETSVRELVTQGAQNILVVPMFIAAGGHVLNDLPHQVAALQTAHPGLTVRIGQVMGDLPGVQRAMADAVKQQLAD